MAQKPRSKKKRQPFHSGMFIDLRYAAFSCNDCWKGGVGAVVVDEERGGQVSLSSNIFNISKYTCVSTVYEKKAGLAARRTPPKGTSEGDWIFSYHQNDIYYCAVSVICPIFCEILYNSLPLGANFLTPCPHNGVLCKGHQRILIRIQGSCTTSLHQCTVCWQQSH